MKIRSSCDVAVAPDVLFALLHDYTQRQQWDPCFPQVYLLDEPDLATGVFVTYRGKWGPTVTMVYSVYQPPTLATVRLVDSKGPWKNLAICWKITPLPLGGSRLLVTVHVATAPGVASKLITAVVGQYFRFQIWRQMRALRQYTYSAN
ncbi:MAG: SRPBCC family protein [Agitococcus sp.]|nr:SRPBCC family protein [Agitococcus sp.]MDO9177158.1 SRPBCC family protein [Agitococcus sp.]